jgi:hypothetical protein
MLVPACAGSMPARASANGRPVPSSTLANTMQSSEKEMATELMRLPDVM